MNRRKGAAGWLGLYTAMFLLSAGVIALIALLWKKTLVWNPDGVRQIYTVMGYVGRAVRDLLAGRGLPMMSYSLGQGMDALTTMTFYGYTDPINLVGALFTGDGIEIGYAIATFLRMYLSGAFLGLYARRVGAKDGWATACAALIYACGGYILRMVGRHPHFINGAIYLPLLLIGIERVLDGRRWLMYVLVTALMLIVNFYFAYMNTLVAVAYILVRLAFRLRDRGAAESAKDGLMLLGGYLLGLAISAVVMLPVAKAYLSNSRLGAEAGYRGSMLYYFPGYYAALAALMFAPWHSPGNFTSLNFAPLALFGLMGLVTVRTGRARQIRIALLLCAAAACIPAAGKVFNGMGYVSNRWFYVVALFVALGCAVGLPRLLTDRAHRTAMVAIALVYAAGVAAYAIREHQYPLLAAPVLIAATAALVMACRRGALRQAPGKAKGLLAGLLAVSCAAYAAIGFLPLGYDCISQQADRNLYTASASRAAAQLIDDDGAYRVAQSGWDDAHSALLGYMGTSYYWSLVDAENSEYYYQLQMPTQNTTYHLYNLGAGAAANAVASVKYFVQTGKRDSIVPYGYEPAGEIALPDGGTAAIHKNAWALPLGYCYDLRLPRAEYDALDATEKLQALTRCAVTEDGASVGGVPRAAFEATTRRGEWSLQSLEGVEWAGDRLRVQAGGRMTLALEMPEDGEQYLILEGIRVLSAPDTHDALMTVRSPRGQISCNVPNPDSNFYFPKDSLAVCLGAGRMDRVEILFENDAVYRLGGIRAVSLPLSDYEADMKARRGEALRDVALSNDRLTGVVSTAGERILQIAVPYSQGWRAWVDGRETPVFRCGGLYMGLALTAGEHVIEMRYETPGLRTGAWISAAALAAALILAALDARRRRRAVKTDQSGRA